MLKGSERHSRRSNNKEYGIVQGVKEGFFENMINKQRSERLKIPGEGGRKRAEGTVCQVPCKELVAGRRTEGRPVWLEQKKSYSKLVGPNWLSHLCCPSPPTPIAYTNTCHLHTTFQSWRYPTLGEHTYSLFQPVAQRILEHLDILCWKLSNINISKASLLLPAL